MSSKSPLYAAIDLGSNSFHMLVVREVEGAIRTVAKVKRKVRLASGLDDNNLLNQDAMERGWYCLSLFAEQLQDIPKENIRVVGTATLRLATNVDTFLKKAQHILNHEIEVISGQLEAETIYQGVSYTSSGEGNRLVIDIGGASTELVVGEENQAKLLNSLNMGCVTWLKQHFPNGELTQSNFQAAINAAKAVLSPIAGSYLEQGWQTCVGASGTVQALQEIMLAQGQSEQVTLDKLNQLKQQTIDCSNMKNLVLEGLTAERLTVFPSGLAILIAIFETLKIKSMTLAGGALREGLIYAMIGRKRNSGVRETTVNSLISRYQIDSDQAEHVRDTALELYRQVEIEWQLDEHFARPILRWAAMLYEIGLCIEYKKAPQHAAYIIDNIDLPGFTPAQKQLLSALLLNQRGELQLQALLEQNALSAEDGLKLVRLLRIAIKLCMRRTQGTVPKFHLHLSGSKLILQLPKGWSQDHPLRAAELQAEVEEQNRHQVGFEIRET